jgi:hypothetical protein
MQFLSTLRTAYDLGIQGSQFKLKLKDRDTLNVRLCEMLFMLRVAVNERLPGALRNQYAIEDSKKFPLWRRFPHRIFRMTPRIRIVFCTPAKLLSGQICGML